MATNAPKKQRQFFWLTKNDEAIALMKQAKLKLGGKRADLLSDADALRAGLKALALFAPELDEKHPGWFSQPLPEET